MGTRLRLAHARTAAMFHTFHVATTTAPFEACVLSTVTIGMAVLGYLDVRHKDLFGTTHVTGTWLHYGLRNAGFDLLIRLSGSSARGGASETIVFIYLAYAAPLLHAALSYASGKWWLRLDERGGPPSIRECAVGLAASYACVAATLHML